MHSVQAHPFTYLFISLVNQHSSILHNPIRDSFALKPNLTKSDIIVTKY